MKNKRTQKTQEDLLWALWNNLGRGNRTSEEELLILHEKMGIREQAACRPVRAIATAFSVAAALALVCAVLAVRLYGLHHLRDDLSASSFIVSAGAEGPSTVILPDGTKVLLNARSSLSYSPDFGLSTREVSLSGEGFFDVTADKARKFVVSAGNMDITVHGTKFNVYAYPERNIDEVSLVEGSLSVLSGGNELLIKPGEKFIYDKASGNTSLARTDNIRETAWMSSDIIFTHVPLSDVLDDLQRRFGVTITVDDKIDSSDRYTGNLTGRKLPDILSILQMHYHFQYEITDNIIRLTDNEK